MLERPLSRWRRRWQGRESSCSPAEPWRTRDYSTYYYFYYLSSPWWTVANVRCGSGGELGRVDWRLEAGAGSRRRAGDRAAERKGHAVQRADGALEIQSSGAALARFRLRATDPDKPDPARSLATRETAPAVGKRHPRLTLHRQRSGRRPAAPARLVHPVGRFLPRCTTPGRMRKMPCDMLRIITR